MVEDMKKGQLEVNALDQKKKRNSEAEDLYQTLHIISSKEHKMSDLSSFVVVSIKTRAV